MADIDAAITTQLANIQKKPASHWLNLANV